MEAVILARPTQSLGLYIQQSMRPMRPDAANADKLAVIIDHAGNVFRHGMPDDERDWSLESRKKRQRAPMGVQLRTCPKCLRVHPPKAVCPYCGYEYPKPEAVPHTRDGELVKVEAVETLEEDKKRKRMEVGRARTIQELERIAIQRGYSFGWVGHMARIKGLRYEKNRT